MVRLRIEHFVPVKPLEQQELCSRSAIRNYGLSLYLANIKAVLQIQRPGSGIGQRKMIPAARWWS